MRKARSLIRIGRTETVVFGRKKSRLAHKDSAAIPAQTSKPHLPAPEAPATMSEGCRLIASACAVLPRIYTHGGSHAADSENISKTGVTFVECPGSL